MATHTHERTLTTPNGAINYQEAVTDGTESNLTCTIPAGSTDLCRLWTVDITQLKSLFIGCKSGDLTIETNNPGGASASPDDTLTLLEDQPVDWAYGDVMSHPLTADVTQIWVTNAGDADVDLECRALMDEAL